MNRLPFLAFAFGLSIGITIGRVLMLRDLYHNPEVEVRRSKAGHDIKVD